MKNTIYDGVKPLPGGTKNQGLSHTLQHEDLEIGQTTREAKPSYTTAIAGEGNEHTEEEKKPWREAREKVELLEDKVSKPKHLKMRHQQPEREGIQEDSERQAHSLLEGTNKQGQRDVVFFMSAGQHGLYCAWKV